MGATASGLANVDSFRQYVTKGKLPPLNSFSVEGFFKEYYFPTKVTDPKEILTPSFSIAEMTENFTNENEYYLGLELNSVLDGKNQRKPLNLMIILDVSQSMNSYFHGGNIAVSGEDKRKTKLQVAVECVKEIIKVLEKKERFGLILMNNKAHLYQPMRTLDKIDMETLEEKIIDIPTLAGSNTYLQNGILKGIEVMNDVLSEVDTKGMSNRLVVLTDANIQHGLVDRIVKIIASAAVKNKIYTTMLGVGNEQHDLERKIGRIRVHSNKQFKKMLVNDFNYLVNPICFDVVLAMESDFFRIDKVYGVDTELDHSVGELFRVDTVIASDKSEKGVKGGIIIIKLKEKIQFKEDQIRKKFIKTYLRFDTLDGKKHTVSNSIEWDGISQKLKKEQGKVFFENNGIRKSCLLMKYYLIIYESISAVYDQLNLNKEDGMTNPNKDLSIVKSMVKELKEFKKLFIKEANLLKDITLIKKELDIIDMLIYADRV